MAITFKTVAFPDDLFKVSEGTFRLATAHQSSGSVFSRMVRAYGLIQQRWVAECTLAEFEQENWQALEAFIATLEGQVVLFTCHDPLHYLPLGAGAGHSQTAAGSPVTITGASLEGAAATTGATSCQVRTAAVRYANSVLLKGLAVSATVLKPGDHFELGRNLYMVTGTVDSDASGEARVPFRPRLRMAAAVDDIVNFKNPKGRFQLQSSDQGTVHRRASGIGKTGLSLVEVPYV